MAKKVQQTMPKLVNAPVPLLRPPHERFQPVLERLMAKDCDRRYSSARQLLADLARLAL